MTLAYHIQFDRIPDTPVRPFSMKRLYEKAGCFWDDPDRVITLPVSRFYIGDEFCIHRMPNASRLMQLLTYASALNTPLTLLTPFMSDFGMDTCIPILDMLAENDPETEIVVNDWGMLVFLKKKYPSFRLALGRLLNKGLKDPRVESALPADAALGPMITSSTFDVPAFHRKAVSLGVMRLEKDLPPFGPLRLPEAKAIPVGIYFPFGYITSGRVCRTAALTGRENEHFSINSTCSRACKAISFGMTLENLSFPLVQSGNTVFYPYPPKVTRALLQLAESETMRLIYQDIVPSEKIAS